MTEQPSLYGGPPNRRVRTRELIGAKERGEKWPMLTAYDQYTAAIFDEVGIPVLSAATATARSILIALGLPPVVPEAGRMLSGDLATAASA